MKNETEDLKRDIKHLNQENERLLRQLESNKGQSGLKTAQPSDKELVKRLKKRELECQALWDTLKDINNSKP